MSDVTAMTVRWKNAACGVKKFDCGASFTAMKAMEELTPALLVKDATDGDHPLHDYFEWNDEKAGQKYREEQAGYAIRSLEIVYEEESEDANAVRAFVFIREEEENNTGTYMETSVAMADEDLRATVLAQALKELLSWKTRYAHLVEFSDVFTAADEMQGSLGLPDSDGGT